MNTTCRSAHHASAHRPRGFLPGEKSQIKNRAKAERVLRSRLYEMGWEAAGGGGASGGRWSAPATAWRRTYNFPQNRVTDHRIHLTLQLDQVMEGRLDPSSTP